MAPNKVPGPYDVTRNPIDVSDGTSPRVGMPPPGTVTPETAAGVLSIVMASAHSSHGRAPVRHRSGAQSLSAGKQNKLSILEVRAGEHFNAYPEALSVSPDLIKLLFDLQKDNKFVKDKTTDVIERSAIITRSGVLYALSKEQHIKILGGGIQKARDTSPRAVEAHKGIVAEQSDPSAMQAELYVHTHPGLAAPSSEDISNAVLYQKSPLEPTKSLVVSPKRIFLMIPTRETWSKKPSDNRDIVNATFYGGHDPTPSKTVGDMDQGSVLLGIATAHAVHVQIYEYSAPDSFRRIDSVANPSH